jgi:hypothetical protein
MAIGLMTDAALGPYQDESDVIARSEQRSLTFAGARSRQELYPSRRPAGVDAMTGDAGGGR